MCLRPRVECQIRLLFNAAFFLVLVTCMALAQAPGSADPDSILTEITVAQDQSALTVSLPIKNIPVPPKISRLSNPDRLIFDFAGVLPKAGFKQLAVGAHSVKDVRTAIFGNDARGRPITRVVFDLVKPVRYETRNEPGKFMVIVRDDGNIPAPAEKAIAKPSPTPSASRNLTPATVATSSNASGNRLTNVDFGDSSVILTFTCGVTPRKSSLHDPERMVLDFPGVVAGLPSTKSIPDGLRSSLTGIRMAQFREDPPVYRVVFDQPSADASSQLSVEGNRVTVQFGLRPMTTTRSRAKAEVTGETNRTGSSPSTMPPKVQSGSTARLPKPSTTKRELPANGPKVEYTNGLLRIEASNANLADVLYAVAEKTGAAIDMPFSDSMLDQVTFTMGPGKPRDVLSTILEGSGFNYYIVENSSGELEKIILIPK